MVAPQESVDDEPSDGMFFPDEGSDLFGDPFCQEGEDI